MNILIVNNLYPPHHHGGYELRCQQVAEHLQGQGHDVQVVTSSYTIDGATASASIRDDRVHGVRVARFLRQQRLDTWQPRGRLGNLGVVKRQIADATRFGEILDEFSPDVVSWWNMEGLTKVILGMPPLRGVPSLHWIEDGWMIRELGAAGDVDVPFWFDFWRVRWGPRLLRPAVRMALAPVERRVQRRSIPTRVFGVPPAHVCFISEFWRFLHRQAGLVAQSSEVIYGGVSRHEFFAERSPDEYIDGPLRLLYAGFLDRTRGLHTIIEALGVIPPRQRERVQLSIASPGPVPPDEYVAGITRRIADLGLVGAVTFLGRIPHHEMPAVYASHHMLVFASTRNEGMPMVMLEAMCAGCAVIHTGSGGAIELAECASAPMFPKDHPFALSRLLSALEEDRGRVADIARSGQETVLREFTLERMLEKAAAVFSRVAEQGRAPERPTPRTASRPHANRIERAH